jgi:hypothetical protein
MRKTDSPSKNISKTPPDERATPGGRLKSSVGRRITSEEVFGRVLDLEVAIREVLREAVLIEKNYGGIGIVGPREGLRTKATQARSERLALRYWECV